MTEPDRRSSLHRAIDRALPIVEDRLTRSPGAPLEYVRAMLLVGRARPYSMEPPVELESLQRLLVDSYQDLTDAELSEAIDWVERAAAAQRQARTRGTA
jgi:hypothetical protein